MPTVSSISSTTTAMVPMRPGVIGCRSSGDGPPTVTGTAARSGPGDLNPASPMANSRHAMSATSSATMAVRKPAEKALLRAAAPPIVMASTAASRSTRTGTASSSARRRSPR